MLNVAIGILLVTLLVVLIIYQRNQQPPEPAEREDTPLMW
jgi:hypothetical protein